MSETASPAEANDPDLLPEISCRAVASVGLYFSDQHGPEKLATAYSRVGSAVPLTHVMDPKNWVSFDFLVRFVDALSLESGDPGFARKAGLSNASPRALGFAYYMLSAVGTPRLCYEQTIKLGPTYNKVGEFRLEAATNRTMTLRYHSSKQEPNRRVCELRMGQFAGFPTIWDLPPATVREAQCQVNGADSCVYELAWLPNVRPFLGALIGALAGAATGALAMSRLIGFVPALVVGIVVGGSIGLALGFRRVSKIKSDLLNAQNQGLFGSMHELQARMEDIQRLNQTLEQKVEDRTRELSVATSKLQAALDKQVELDRLKTHFFQNISHELRTPLTLILAPLETITSDPNLDREQRMQLDIMRRSAVRLLGLINSLLDLSRLDAGKMRLALDDVDPALLVRQLVETAQGLAMQRGINLTYKGDRSLTQIPLDTDKFEKALLNLVSNALKFTGSATGRTAEVEVSAKIEDGRFLVAVRDTGIGIPETELENIFARFHQVDGSDERRFGGTGIGLALVKEIVEFHGGTVTVTSKHGAGSTFTLNFPTSRDAIPADRLDRRRGREEVAVDRRVESERQKLAQLITNPADLALADISGTAGSEKPATSTRFEITAERPRILIADDNRDMLTYLTTILSREYETLTANDGEEAFELAQAHLPQVIVSDVMMPRKNGYTLVKDLRRDPRTKSIPIILVTAKADVHQKVAGIDIGADDYLTKPFNFLELRARIRQLLRSKALERSLAEKNEYLAKLNFDLVLSKKEVFLQTIEALAFALEAKDTYTHGHSRRVAILSTDLARGLSLTDLEIERVRVAAVLHDIGKLGIPESILRKEGQLVGEERLIIEGHPVIGASILESVKELSDVSRCIFHHHEKFDGTGYPKQLRGFDIPLESRIIAVADTYDAMTSDRPYRKGLSHLRALEELTNFAGTQFDPEIVRKFMHLYEGNAPKFPEFPSAFGKLRA